VDKKGKEKLAIFNTEETFVRSFAVLPTRLIK